MRNIEFKSYEASIENLDVKSGIVTGYFSRFGNVDWDKDVMMPGCYAKSIAERGPKSAKPEIGYLWQHDSYKPLGKLTDLREDAYGLFFEAKISDTTYGLDALKLYRDGVISQHSVGFQTIQAEEKQGYREIKEVRLWEGSAVTWGSNPDTPFTGFKSYTKKEAESRVELLIDRMNKGDYSDDTFKNLHFELLKLHTYISSVTKEEQPKNTADSVNPNMDLLTGLVNVLQQ
jgi:HK97 family phage prohead protease